MSDPRRFFVPPATLLDDRVEMTGETFHHLCNVLRVSQGETVTLLDGTGTCCEVKITATLSDRALGDVLSRWHAEDKSLPITLIQALPKGDKLELILQKGTELGIHCFQPVITRHTIPQLSASRLGKKELRWKKIVNEAARQSRRCHLPEVRPLQKLEEVLSQSTEDLKLVLWEAGAVPLAAALPDKPPGGVRVLIGPEGGFSGEEMATITSAGFRAVHLGPRILRTETAGLAATPVLQYLYGDWRQQPTKDSSTQCEERP